MAYLTIEYPDGNEARIMLLKPEVSIGRSPESDICIDAEWISGHHAQLVRSSDGYAIEDLGSSNGTYINYERVEKNELKDNDLIFLGRTRILYRHGSSELEESAVELDILDDENSGIFTQAPPAKELPRIVADVPPSTNEVVKLLRSADTSDKIPIDAFRRDGIVQKPGLKEYKDQVRELNLRMASLEVELEAQRRRAEKEIDRLMKELNTWKSRYFDRVEESKSLRKKYERMVAEHGELDEEPEEVEEGPDLDES